MNWLVYGLLGLMAIGLVSSIAGVAGGAITAATAQPTPTATPGLFRSMQDITDLHRRAQSNPGSLTCDELRYLLRATPSTVNINGTNPHGDIAAAQNWRDLLVSQLERRCGTDWWKGAQ